MKDFLVMIQLVQYIVYIKNFKRQKTNNEILFDTFKKRNELLIDYDKYLYLDFEIKKRESKLNGEMIINILRLAFYHNIIKLFYSIY